MITWLIPLSSITIVVNRPSLAISTVFKPTSCINGIDKDANTSSAYKINETYQQNRRRAKRAADSNKYDLLLDANRCRFETSAADMRSSFARGERLFL